MEEVRKDGSTVIVVQPPKPDGAVQPSRMSTNHALEVREKVRAILASAPTLWPNIKATIFKEGRFGSFVWVLFGIGIAALGLVLAWLATRPVTRMLANYFRNRPPLADPETTADKARFLLIRAMVAVFITLIYLVVASLVAVALDPGTEASRLLIFEIIIGWTIYRLLRYGVSWNLMAYDAPKNRLVNLTDEEASTMHRDWWMSVIAVIVATGTGRFLVNIGFSSPDGQFNGNGELTLLNAQLLYIVIAAFTIVLLAGLTLRNWTKIQHAFTPRDAKGALFAVRKSFATAAPFLSLGYGILAFVIFVYRVATLTPDAGTVIAGPFLIVYLALIVYGLTLIFIQMLYNRRQRRFDMLAAMERERHQQEQDLVDSDQGEEMIVAPTAVQFEYQPIFRRFFENAALAVVVVVSLGEMGRVLGVPVGAEGNPWAVLLDIVLAAILCWMAYSAISIFIDKRMEQEGGAPEVDEEVGGEGGGAGATRMATLLPILRYVMVATIFSVGGMIILSRMGIDIAPIFAGAGVVGIAVGFGAQTLIRDIFSGAFFLMDDAFRKGEYLEIEGIRGTVEKISVRSFQLRHHLGALHTIPFGEIKQLTNYSRDWVMMKLPLRVTYDTDVEKVRKLVKKLGQELMDHPQVGHTFMQPLKSQGVYKMEDSAMIIRVKFMTKPGEQFVTRKVVYESIQALFAREGIHFAHKEVTVRLADADANSLSESEKKAVTAAARSVIDADEEAAAAAAGAPAGGGR
ncbi:MAG: mechanosensitive ion channel domain-containing protein [Pseudomonadota bacterium]